MQASELVDKYVRLQSALVGFVTPSLVSASFEALEDGTTRVRLVYWKTTPEDERAVLATLEDRVRQAFDGRVTMELIFLHPAESAQALEWPVFRVRQKTED